MNRILIGLASTLLLLIITGAGYLILSKPDAPQGTSTTEAAPLRLFYYNAEKDEDETGNVLCSSQGLDAVERELSLDQTSIEEAVKLLLKGGLSADEKGRGISTEYPLPGLTLKSAIQSGDVVTLTFDDPQNKTSGGACRASILRAQIEATAKQFPGVQTVEIQPEDLFQP